VNRIFVDTSAWLALLNTADQYHFQSKQIRDELIQNDTKLYTSSFVLAELANGLSKLKYRNMAIDFIERVKSGKEVQIVFVGEELFERSWKLFKSRTDKEWGFVDCTSFVIMKKLKIRHSFSNDKHFTQCGFINLL